MVAPHEVRDSLKALPETLAAAYGEIYNRICNQGHLASQLALNAFRWVQCSYEPLRSETLLDAVTVEVDGSGKFSRNGEGIRSTDLLKVCQNLLILDERLNVFRFAHLSVQEYLETQQLRVDSHTEIAKICLSLVCSSRSWRDYDTTLETREGNYHDRHLLLYSAVFWPWHLNRCKEDCQILTCLWEAFVSEVTFQPWIKYHCQRVQTKDSKDTFWRRSEAVQLEGRDLLATVCLFGLGRKLSSIPKSQFGWMTRIKLKLPTKLISKSVRRGRVVRLLHYASSFGDREIVQHLLDVGVGVSAVDRYRRTPLHLAAMNGHEALALQLLDQGADPSAVERYRRRTPLHLAAMNGLEALALQLLDRGANPSAVDRYKRRTPLHLAAMNGHEALALQLLDRGADPSAADRYRKRTPLHLAAMNGLHALALQLLDRGANPSAVDRYRRRTPLHLAAMNRHEALALQLLDRGANPSAVDRYRRRTPLHLAAMNGLEALALQLLDRGADTSAVDRYRRRTPLHLAAMNGLDALALQLLDRGGDASAVDRYGRTPLHLAAMSGHEALALQLLDRGADASAVDRYGRTPLHLAAMNGHEALAQLLAATTAPPSSQ